MSTVATILQSNDVNNVLKSPRINLRKRSIVDLNDTTASYKPIPSTFSSSFLSGIFSDIKTNNSSNDDNAYQHDEETSLNYVSTDNDSRDDCGQSSPTKKSRVSMTRSISRCARSYKNLAIDIGATTTTDINDTATTINFFDGPAIKLQEHLNQAFNLACPVTPNGNNAATATNKDLTTAAAATTNATTTAIPRHNSLLDQLHCVSSSSSNDLSSSGAGNAITTDICALAFPNLPATVSNTDLTQMMSSRHSSDDLTKKESYGWFVDLDDQHNDDEQPKPQPLLSQLSHAISSSSIAEAAFSVSTAPKSSSISNDADVEWAQAADTVDDVLGDFF